jgi:hypothetical protein
MAETGKSLDDFERAIREYLICLRDNGEQVDDGEDGLRDPNVRETTFELS